MIISRTVLSNSSLSYSISLSNSLSSIYKARLDYFLVNDDALDLVKKVGIGKESILSDHRPIYLHISLSKVQKGSGFWRLKGDFLTEPEYVFGVNNVIERVISQYSEQQNCLP